MIILARYHLGVEASIWRVQAGIKQLSSAKHHRRLEAYSLGPGFSLGDRRFTFIAI
jgi:hypothetical protein